MNNFNEKQKRTERRKWQEIKNNRKIPEERKKEIREKKGDVSERGMEKKHGEWMEESACSATLSTAFTLSHLMIIYWVTTLC